MKSKKKNKKWKVDFAPSFFESAEKLFSNDLKYLIPRKIDDWKFEIEWAWQRVFRGYDDRMIWDLHFYLSEYLPKIIRKLAKNAYGYPASINKKDKKEFKNIKDWKNTLEKIAKGFDAAGKIDRDEFMKKIKLKKPRKDMFGEDSYIDYKVDKKYYKQLTKEFNVGIELFKKYFFNLWD